MKNSAQTLFQFFSRSAIFFLTGLMLLSGLPVSDQPKQLKAGAAIVDITPQLGQGIIGNFTIPPATHIHDPLQARCLVLDDGQTRLAFVVVDNVGISKELFAESKRMVQTETGIPPSNILMSCTHTHSAVSAGGEPDITRSFEKWKDLDDYQKFVARRMADGIRIAINNLEPARLGWGAGSVPQHVFNRRWRMKEKVRSPYGDFEQVLFNPGFNNPNKLEPAGGVDPEVSFFSVQSANGRPIALFANYSLHYVGGVPSGHISADYFSIFADKIKEKIGQRGEVAPFVGFMTNGTSGDVNNINFAGPVPSHQPYEKMNIVAEDVANEIFRAYQKLEYKSDIALSAAYSEIPIGVRKPSPQLLTRSQEIVKKPEGTKFEHSLEKVFAQRAILIQNNWPDKVAVPLQVFRLGDLGIAAIPFEVFTETGLELKKAAPFAKAFTISFANGSYGYLATPAQHKLGGYETWLTVTKVEETASEKIAKEILKLMAQAKGQ